MVEELARSKAGVGHDKNKCGCTMKKVFKLPCACELGLLHLCGSSIELSNIDSHWKHLSLDVFDDKKSTQSSFRRCDISLEIAGILERFEKLSEDEQFVLKKVLGEIAWPSTNSLVAPLDKAKTKGAPKKKKFFDEKREPSGWEHVDKKVKLSLTSEPPTSSKKSSQPASKKLTQGASRKISQTLETQGHLQHILPHMHQFVERITNVGDDGNCGFRAIAVGLDWGEESWSLVRQDLIKESHTREEMYRNIYGEELLGIRKAFTPAGHGPQLSDKWLSMPEMGCFVATKYNVALVTLSLEVNTLYLPLRGSYDRCQQKSHVICIMNNGKNHWMNVKLSPDAPLPPVDPLYWSVHSHEAESWINTLMGRVHQWTVLDTRTPAVDPSSYDHPVDLAADTDDVLT